MKVIQIGAANPFAPPAESSDPDYVFEFQQDDQGGGLQAQIESSPLGPLVDLIGFEELLYALDGNPDYSMNQDIA